MTNYIRVRRYLGPDYGDASAVGERDAVTAVQVPGLARQSFPLCMALMTQHLHAEHHLRHGGRIQLGLFLKVRPSSATDAFGAQGGVAQLGEGGSDKFRRSTWPR